MKLLIVTQKVDSNDDTLGFFTRWIDEFSHYAENIEVICLEKGDYDAPKNVTVHTLGKEDKQSRLGYILNFYRLLFTLRKKYDHVFVHMNPIYVVLAGWYWKLKRVPVALWYTHRKVDTKLKIAEKCVNVIFTAAPESFTLASKKVRVVGHGIDFDQFVCKDKILPNVFRVMSVGRITPIKNCATLIRAAAIMKKTLIKQFVIEFVGKPNTKEDEVYFESMKKLVKELDVEDRISFVGSIPNKAIRDRYCQVSITVNMAPTGGLDKVVLESMAAGVPALVSNRAFIDYFNEYAPMLVFEENNSEELAQKILNMYDLADSKRMALSVFLQQTVEKRASLSELIPKLIHTMQG